MFEKDSKLCLNVDQILILQEYLIELNATNQTSKDTKKLATSSNNKEYLLLCKSPHLYLIQDFLFKVTNLKVIYCLLE